MGIITNAYIDLVGKYLWKRPLGRPICRWEYNIKTGLKMWTVMVWVLFM
jgi:hypothetical protein